MTDRTIKLEFVCGHNDLVTDDKFWDTVEMQPTGWGTVPELFAWCELHKEWHRLKEEGVHYLRR